MEIIPRFEFRVWGEHLDSAQARLLDLGTLRERRQSSETYIVSRAEDANVKIRAGVLDIKRLLDRRDRLEQWKPVFKAAFPIDAGVLADTVFAVLGVGAPRFAEGPVGEESFASAADRIDGVMTIPLRKERSLVSVGECQTEASVVTVDNEKYLTIAVESEELMAVEETIARLGIGEYENESYPTLLRRLRWA